MAELGYELAEGGGVGDPEIDCQGLQGGQKPVVAEVKKKEIERRGY